MINNPDEVIESTQDIIGLDAYHIYPDSKRLIPEAVLWAFASACLLEFLKGFVDFKMLGEGLRSKINGLLLTWRTKQDLEAYAKIEGVDQAVLAAIQACPKTITSEQRQEAITRLSDALVSLGIPKGTADQHARQIEQLVVSATSRS